MVKALSIIASAAALLLGASQSLATVINSSYTSLGGTAWLADFTIRNDGSPASFAGFTIDFPNATNLSLVASPATWDSAVFQPDINLPDDGFIDSFVRNASSTLAVGQSIGGFRVSFTYAPGTPGALPFVINSASFAPLMFGMTTVTPVPEPAAALSLALGLATLGLRISRARRPANNAIEVNT